MLVSVSKFYRGCAAAVLVLSLAACAGTAKNEAAAPAKDDLAAFNDTFRAAYREARAVTISGADPVFVVQFDDLHLIRGGRTRTERFTPPIYHDYKAFAHIPPTLYVKLAPKAGRPFDKAMLDWLADYRKRIQAAAASLDGRAGWTPDQIRLHRSIAAASEEFIGKAAGAGEVNPAELAAYARSMRPLVLASADAAAKAQLDGLHVLVTKWKTEIGPEAWSRAQIVVLGPKQPRAGNVQYLYFVRALGRGAESKRLWYAEGVFDKDGGVSLMATILLDRAASIAFFGDPARLERDLLADGAARHLDRLFPRR